jgi:hypothetical protein
MPKKYMPPKKNIPLPNLHIRYADWNNILFKETPEIKEKLMSFNAARIVSTWKDF